MRSELWAIAGVGVLTGLGVWASRAGGELGRPGGAMVVIHPVTGKVLLLRRSQTDPWRPGWWNLPGGGVESGETSLQGAIRETREEAGLVVHHGRPTYRIEGPGWRVDVFVTRKWSGDVQIDYESDAFAWVRPEELQHFKLLPGVKQAILSATT